MAGKGRPGPAPIGGKGVKKVSVALRDEDLEFLSQLAVAMFVAAGRADAAKLLLSGHRPSVSLALRRVIDDYRERHGGQVVAMITTKKKR